jgi:hypothetical protein
LRLVVGGRRIARLSIFGLRRTWCGIGGGVGFGEVGDGMWSEVDVGGVLGVVGWMARRS